VLCVLCPVCLQVWSILLAQAELLGVLECEGQEMVVAQGGRGGRGNAMAPSNHQRPASKVRSDGKIGQEVRGQLHGICRCQMLH
jgi:GTPase involved in cell partitioning and DNA repair